MATYKKGNAKAKTSPRGKKNGAPGTVDSLTVRLMVVCFTVLSLVFAALAFWRYW